MLIPASLSALAVEKNPGLQNPNLISISVKQAPVSELFEMLSRQYNVNISLSTGIEATVSVNLYNIALEEAIISIANAADLAVERLADGGYLISKRSNAGKYIAGGLTDVRTYKIQYTDVKKLSEVIKTHLSLFGKVEILEDRKMLVVEDKPDFLNRVERMLEQLDQPPGQILIEARILTIDLNENQQYGIDWTKTFSTAGGGAGNFGAQNLGTPTLDYAIGAAAGPPGLFFNYFNRNIQAQLNLLSQKGRTHALATPSLMVLENQEAEVIIGARTGYQVTTTINMVTTQSIQFLESGVILKVKPHIDRFGRIMMDIHPEVSKTTLNAGIPSLTTTEVNTHLLVEDGQMIFIGGLISNNLTDNYQGVPFLQDIPFLGNLFAKGGVTAENVETIVTIKPQIIYPENKSLVTAPIDEADRYSEQSQKKNQEINDFFDGKTMHNHE